MGAGFLLLLGGPFSKSFCSTAAAAAAKDLGTRCSNGLGGAGGVGNIWVWFLAARRLGTSKTFDSSGAAKAFRGSDMVTITTENDIVCSSQAVCRKRASPNTVRAKPLYVASVAQLAPPMGEHLCIWRAKKTLQGQHIIFCGADKMSPMRCQM